MESMTAARPKPVTAPELRDLIVEGGGFQGFGGFEDIFSSFGDIFGDIFGGGGAGPGHDAKA